jgi:uncharacterized protein YneF (UPF0154 family)
MLVGAVIGFFVSRTVFKKYLEKNPPINENMIRAMMSQMGRKPSEKQVKQVMAAMNAAKLKNNVVRFEQRFILLFSF